MTSFVATTNIAETLGRLQFQNKKIADLRKRVNTLRENKRHGVYQIETIHALYTMQQDRNNYLTAEYERRTLNRDPELLDKIIQTRAMIYEYRDILQHLEHNCNLTEYSIYHTEIQLNRVEEETAALIKAIEPIMVELGR